MAAVTSAIVFPVMYVLGVTTTLCTMVGVRCRRDPELELNRRWTWKVEGRVAFGREIVAYLVISATTLVILSLVTGGPTTL